MSKSDINEKMKQYLLEMTKIIKRYFRDEPQIDFAKDVCSIIQNIKSSQSGSNFNFKTKQPLLMTEGKHKWSIEIKSTTHRISYKITNNQMKYKVLDFIDYLQKKRPKAETNQEIQNNIFLHIYPCWLKFKLSENPKNKELKISKFDRFLQDMMELTFEFSPSERSFEKWVRNYTKQPKPSRLDYTEEEFNELIAQQPHRK